MMNQHVRDRVHWLSITSLGVEPAGDIEMLLVDIDSAGVSYAVFGGRA